MIKLGPFTTVVCFGYPSATELLGRVRLSFLGGIAALSRGARLDTRETQAAHVHVPLETEQM